MKPSKGSQFNWDDFLNQHRDAIIREWVKRLGTEISERYSQRPESELRQTISASFAANCRFLISGEKDELDRFIAQISNLRLEGGFPLVDVQKAFDLFRHIVLPLLASSCGIETFHSAVVEINDCMVESLDAAGTGKKRQRDVAEQIKCLLNIHQGKAPFKSQVGYLRDKAVEFILFAKNQETAVGRKRSADGLVKFRLRSEGISFADLRSQTLDPLADNGIPISG